MTPNRTAEPPVPTLVVGGGIGGLAAALAVAGTGRPVRVIERTPRFTELGAGIQLAANATRVLAGLGVLEAVEEAAVHPERAVLLDARTGRQLAALRLGRPYRQHYGFPYLVVHRGDLLGALVRRCEANPLVTLETSREVDRVVPSASTATVHFTDGGRYDCEVVVGADGLNSRIRRLVAQDQPRCSGFVTYRGTVPVQDAVRGAHAGDVLVWIGPDLHLVQYPIRRGELYNQAAVFRSPSWTPDAAPADWGGPAELDQCFADCCEPVRTAVSSLERDRRWPVRDRAPLRRWGQGRVTLLGDAAHAMVQYLAQGACQALEDAAELARALAVAATEPEAALRAYEAVRIPRTAHCQRTALTWGQLWHTQDPLTMMLRDRVLASRADSDYADTDWLYAPVRGPGSAQRSESPVGSA